MTAPDVERVLREVSTLARRASDLALGSPDFPAREAATILEVLTGARLDWHRVAELGPERAGAVHFAKSIVVLASMLGARHGLNIGMAGVLDDLRTRTRGACTADERPLHGPCGRHAKPCQRPFRASAAGSAIGSAIGPGGR